MWQLYKRPIRAFRQSPFCCLAHIKDGNKVKGRRGTGDPFCLYSRIPAELFISSRVASSVGSAVWYFICGYVEIAPPPLSRNNAPSCSANYRTRLVLKRWWQFNLSGASVKNIFQVPARGCYHQMPSWMQVLVLAVR